VALGTAAFYRPRRSVLLVAGSAVALAGVAFVFLPGLVLDTLPGEGIALALAGSFVIALGTVIARRVMPGNDPVAVSALASGVAVVPVLLLSFTAGGIQPILDAPRGIQLLLVYVGVGCTAMNFVLWYYGLKYLSAASASAFQYLIPPFGVAFAALFLGEPLTATLLLGTACILAGLIVTQIAA
jgi:drug/metabolite transporter (DMT)-like permease